MKRIRIEAERQHNRHNAVPVTIEVADEDIVLDDPDFMPVYARFLPCALITLTESQRDFLIHHFCGNADCNCQSGPPGLHAVNAANQCVITVPLTAVQETHSGGAIGG
jgi:hypothetical protein